MERKKRANGELSSTTTLSRVPQELDNGNRARVDDADEDSGDEEERVANGQ